MVNALNSAHLLPAGYMEPKTTEIYRKVPKTYRKLNYGKLTLTKLNSTLTLNLTLTLTLNPKPLALNRIKPVTVRIGLLFGSLAFGKFSVIITFTV